jgi:hypothetical protein
MKTKKNALLIILMSLVLWLVIMPLRGHYIPFIDFQVTTIIYAISFFFFTRWVLRKYKEQLKALHIMLLVLLGCVSLEILVYIVFADTFKSFPDLLCRIISVVAAYWVSISERKYAKYIILGSAAVVALLVYIEGAEWWLSWWKQLQYG